MRWKKLGELVLAEENIERKISDDSWGICGLIWGRKVGIGLVFGGQLVMANATRCESRPTVI